MGVPLRANAEIVKGRLQDRQQPMDPMIRLRLAQVEELALDDLQRIGLEVDQDEQELLLGSMQESLATSAGRTLAGLAGNGLVRGIQPLIGPAEGGQQPLELRDRQSCEGQKLPSIALECCIRHHKAIVALFPITSCPGLPGNDPSEGRRCLLYVMSPTGARSPSKR